MSNSANDVHSLKIKSEALATLEPLAERLMARHKENRRLWFPGDFLAASEQMTDEQARDMAELPERARGMPDAVRVAVALNLLTEEGLPHFHRLLAVTLGSDNAWARWNYMWTAEEDRHGCALHDYVRDARLFDMRAFEVLQYQYIESGFDPESSGDPYQVIAYTTLQERATQTAHANTARVAGQHEPIIQRLLAHVASDESRHFRFYRDIFRGILDIDCTRALQAALKVVPRLAMPGHTIPGYMEMAEVVGRSGIYGPRHYRKVVAECLDAWEIGRLSPDDADGRKAQDRLMAVPERLDRLADILEKRTRSKSFSFDFIYARVMELN